MEIWVNPACSKCAAALSIVDETDARHTVRRHLEDPPTPAELAAVLDRLGLDPWDIARTGEPAAKELDPPIITEAAVRSVLPNQGDLVQRRG